MRRSSLSALHPLLLVLAVLTLSPDSAGAEIALDRTTLSSLDTTRLTAYLEQISQRTLDSGIRNFTPYALVLIRQSYEAVRRGDLQRADILARHAQKLAPELPAAYLARGWAQWCGDQIRIDHLVRGYIRALASRIYSIEDLSLTLFSSAAIIVAAFILTLFIFTMISLLKHAKLFLHDLRHVIPRAVPSLAVWGTGIVIFLLPLLLNLALPLCCLVWLGVLFGYHTRREKYAVMGLIGLFALLPLVVSTAGFGLYMPQSRLIRLLEKVNHGYWSSGDLDALECYHREHPDDREVLLSLGLIHKREKNYRTAQRYYERLLDLSPNSYQAHVNIGNVYLATGRWQDAVDAYEHAIALQPVSTAAAHFNLARAYQQKYMFTEAEQALARAKMSAPHLINRALKIYSENSNRLVIDETVPRTLLWQKGYQMYCAETRVPDALWDLLFTGLPQRFASGVLLCFGVLILMTVRNDTGRIAAACPICGQAFCNRCQKSIGAERICAQCVNFSQKKDNIDFRLKEKKILGIKRHRGIYQIIGTTLSLCVPGAGHIWHVHTLKGTICLFIFFMLLFKLTAVGALGSPWPFMETASAVEMILLGLTLAGYWLALFVSASRLRARELHDSPLI